ncbi:MAG: glucuronate isomerase [Kiritimatiellia bacterium]|nr:glucuronate isomerase [Kiritimatiellia bacterium]
MTNNKQSFGVRQIVSKLLATDSASAVRIVDIHTHLFDPAMGGLLLWGIDELVTYHYLVAEVFRARPDLGYDKFWQWPKRKQADLIWNELFVKRSPLSEACRGVLSVLQAVGLDPNAKKLDKIRKYFSSQNVRDYTNLVFKLAGVSAVYMTNDPLDTAERKCWQKGFKRDHRFLAALRLDSCLMNWPGGMAALQGLGYDVDSSLSGRTLSEVRRYLSDWRRKMDARYMAISLPPSFRYPADGSPLAALLAKAVIPVAREYGLPVAMMIGVKKLVNPALRLAGDSVGRADLSSIEHLAHEFGDVRFMVTTLSRENTHELCIIARKFKNVLPFGCWWFLNNPELIQEMTAMRLELLGLSFIPQHSDARVLDQLIYKWKHSRVIIGEVLSRKYEDIVNTGRKVSEADVKRDLAILFGDSLMKAGH